MCRSPLQVRGRPVLKNSRILFVYTARSPELCETKTTDMIDNQKNEMLKSLRGFAKMSLDFSFKRVFGNESNKGALIAFLNRVIDGVDIEDVQLLPTERLGLTSSDRKAVFDVFCRGKDGTEFIVEMQCAKQKYFKERALYYAGYPLVEQGRSAFERYVEMCSSDMVGCEKGSSENFKWDFNLKPIIFIAVLDFSMPHLEGWPDDRYFSSYRLCEDTMNEAMTDKLRFIFLELGRFNKCENELHDMTDKWMYALKHMHEFIRRPDELKENELDTLFNLAKIANFTPEDINSYLDELIMERDYWNIIDTAKEEAMEEGRAEGLAEGLAEGRAEGERAKALEIARQLIQKGMPVAEVAEITGIPVTDF